MVLKVDAKLLYCPDILFRIYLLSPYYYEDLFTHKDINTYIKGVVKICWNKFFFEKFPKEKRKNMQNYAQIENIDFYSLHNIWFTEKQGNFDKHENLAKNRDYSRDQKFKSTNK